VEPHNVGVVDLCGLEVGVRSLALVDGAVVHGTREAVDVGAVGVRLDKVDGGGSNVEDIRLGVVGGVDADGAASREHQGADTGGEAGTDVAEVGTVVVVLHVVPMLSKVLRELAQKQQVPRERLLA